MTLSEFLASLPMGGRKRFAERLGISASYLSQLSSGVRPCAIELAAKIARESAGKCRVEEIRPDVDWALLRSPTGPREEAA